MVPLLPCSWDRADRFESREQRLPVMRSIRSWLFPSLIRAVGAAARRPGTFVYAELCARVSENPLPGRYRLNRQGSLPVPTITKVSAYSAVVDFLESSRLYPSVSGNIKLKTRSVGSIHLFRSTKVTPSCHAKSRNWCGIPFVVRDFWEISGKSCR